MGGWGGPLKASQPLDLEQTEGFCRVHWSIFSGPQAGVSPSRCGTPEDPGRARLAGFGPPTTSLTGDPFKRNSTFPGTLGGRVRASRNLLEGPPRLCSTFSRTHGFNGPSFSSAFGGCTWPESRGLAVMGCGQTPLRASH